MSTDATGVQPGPGAESNSHNFSHTPRNDQKRHATPGNRFPSVFRGFLNDPGHLVYVGENINTMAFEEAASNASWVSTKPDQLQWPLIADA
jgi:hypothetical protein